MKSKIFVCRVSGARLMPLSRFRFMGDGIYRGELGLASGSYTVVARWSSGESMSVALEVGTEPIRMYRFVLK